MDLDNFIGVRPLLSFILAVLSFASLCAQPGSPPAAKTYAPEQCIIGFYDQDSIAMRMKGFKPLFDTVVAMEKRLGELRNKSFVATDKALMMAPDSNEVQDLNEARAYKTVYEEAKQLEADVKDAQFKILLFKGKHFQPYHDKIAKAADTVARNKGIRQVFEMNSTPQLTCPTDQTLMVDLTRDVAEHLGIKLYSLRIGIINRDSILRLMPGYAVRADSTLEEQHALDLVTAQRNAIINAKQHELDSLRPTLSRKAIEKREEEIQQLKDERDEHHGWTQYAIDKRNEQRTSVYISRLNTVIGIVAKEYNCRHVYDINDDIPWTTREAEYFNLNQAMVSQLKL